MGGGAGAPVSEETFVEYMMAHAENQVIDGVCCSTMMTIEGRTVKTGSPLEAHASKYENAKMRDAVTRIGRPGIHLMGICCAATAMGHIAAAWPTGLRKTDAHGTSLLNDLKISFDYGLTKAMHLVDYGAIIRPLYAPTIGGMAGGPEGVAVASVASFILAPVALEATYSTLHPVHMRYFATTGPEALWVSSMVGQAFSRNTHILLTTNIFTGAGPCTEMILDEVAAQSIANTVSGLSLGPSVGSANSKYQDYVSPLEAIFQGEVGHATARSKITRREANEIVNKLLTKYENRLLDAAEGKMKGKRFQECYELSKATYNKGPPPSQDWTNIYAQVKSEIADLGINFEGD